MANISEAAPSAFYCLGYLISFSFLPFAAKQLLRTRRGCLTPCWSLCSLHPCELSDGRMGDFEQSGYLPATVATAEPAQGLLLLLGVQLGLPTEPAAAGYRSRPALIGPLGDALPLVLRYGG